MNTKAYIHLIEEISLNAWPSHKIELYDGWLIRFSHNYTHRTNSVEQVGASNIPIEEKVAYCEEMYRNYRTPSSFKINPLMDPAFDSMLEERGYEVQHTTEVMTMPMSHFRPTISDVRVQIQERITDEWIFSLFRLNGTTDSVLQRIVPSMFKAIPKETIVASVECDGLIAATGLGILDRGHIGLYAIYVDKHFRRRNFARAICNAILTEAQKKGADRAYLQVVKGNTSAKDLYMSLGFEDFYTYWFRTKPM